MSDPNQDELRARPVAIARLPPEIKEALRRHGLPWPRSHMCFRNSQEFFLRAGEEFGERLEYREGVIRGLAEVLNDLPDVDGHAWLTLDGSIVDLTVDRRLYFYGPSYSVSLQDMRSKVQDRDVWGAIHLAELEQLRATGFAAPEVDDHIAKEAMRAAEDAQAWQAYVASRPTGWRWEFAQ